MQPIIPLSLNLTKGTTVNIECWGWGGNVVQDNLQGYGYVKFSVQVQS